MHPVLDMQLSKLLGTHLLPGDVGIELEIEGLHLPRQVTGWSRHVENSLRGANGRVIQGGEDLEDTPQEYVTNGPIQIDSVPTVLNQLIQKLKKTPVMVNLTQRASTHIHLNMAAETVSTLFNFIIVFTVAEPVLLRLCGPLRNGNLFCLPSYETGEMPQYIQKIRNTVTAIAVKEKITPDHALYIRQTWPSRGKYAALNLDPLKTLGSVECRCFPNSIDPNEINNWATWLVRMRTMAREMSVTDLRQFLDGAYNNPMGFLSKIFPLGGIFTACQPNHPSELVAFGVEQAYETMVAMFELIEWKADTQKKGKKKGLLLSSDDEMLLEPFEAVFDDEDAP